MTTKQDDGRPRQVLLIPGSLRARSTNTAAPRTVQADGVLLLESVAKLRSEIHSSDAILISTPEHAGALPGSLKNLLDWTIGDAETGSIYEEPLGWINVSPRGAPGALGELRTVLQFAHARIVDGAVADVPVTHDMVGPDGLIRDRATRGHLADVLHTVVGQPPSGS